MSRCRNLNAWKLSLLGCLFSPLAAHAAESYDNCTGFITSLPATIATQGTWCMKHDLSTAITSGRAITVNTNNVTIDCNDFKLGGLQAGTGTNADGIYAIDRLNLRIRHCNIRGFFHGVFIDGTGSSSSGHAIEDSLFDGNTYIGADIHGDAAVIRRNRIVDTGGSSNAASAYGIVGYGSIDILDNTIVGVVAGSAGGHAIAVFTDGSSGSINGNRVRDLFKNGGGNAYGVYNSNSGYVVMRDNDVLGDAGTGSVGLLCNNANGSAKDNVIDRFVTALNNCTNDGGNVIKP